MNRIGRKYRFPLCELCVSLLNAPISTAPSDQPEFPPTAAWSTGQKRRNAEFAEDAEEKRERVIGRVSPNLQCPVSWGGHSEESSLASKRTPLTKEAMAQPWGAAQ